MTMIGQRPCSALPCALALAAVFSFAAAAQESIDTSRRNAIVNAIAKVSPAVVTITVVQIQAERVPDPFFDDFWGLFGAPLDRSHVRGRAVESIGSGFLFDADGHILTNYHVLQDANRIGSVILPDGRDLKVKLVGADEHTDVAVLQATGDHLPFIPLGRSDDLLTGEWAIAIGNPFGNMMRDPQPSVSVGVISANHRRVSRDVGGGERLYQDLIQTDAAINPGNSGGPLVNARGEVIGVNTMIFSSSGGSQGLGFAIPIDRVKRVAQELIQYGHRRNPWFGFRGEAISDLAPYSLQQLGIQMDSGVLVSEIVTTSPAYVAGLRLGDVVTEVNGETVHDPTDVNFVNWGLFVGDSARLTVNRRGETLNITFAVAEVQER